MDKNAAPRPPAGVLAIPRWEFITLTAALMALNSLAIDIMLPGLQQIGASLGVDNDNHRQYVVTAYILGFGIAQLFYGPLSDRYGRRGPLIAGMLIYAAAAGTAAVVPSFATLLLCRFVQGVGAAATRVIAVSVVRDVFDGRRMAEVMSLIFMVFMALPIVAPSIGQFIMLFATWHSIFGAMAVGAVLVTVWAVLRLPETLRPEDRRPLDVATILGGFRIVLTNRVALCYTAASTFMFGSMFGFVSSAQQIYVDVYHVGTLFPIIFAGGASVMALSNFMNSRLVGRLGMRRMSQGALMIFLAISVIWVVLAVTMPVSLVLFIIIFTCAMVPIGALGANFNALAMEPLGHIAGTASAVLGFAQTFVGGIIGAIIGQAFNGTVAPLGAGFCIVSAGAMIAVMIAEKGKLFQPQNQPVESVAWGE